MEGLSEKVKKYFGGKAQCIFGAILSVFLLVISIKGLFLAEKKAMLICVAFSLFSGFVFSLKKFRGKIFSFIFLFLFVTGFPYFCFKRGENCVHDLTMLETGVIKLTYIIIFILFFVFLFFSQRTGVACMLTVVLTGVLYIINYYVFTLRGGIVSVSDLSASMTAVSVLDSYTFSLTPPIANAIVWFVTLAVIGYKADIPIKGYRYHIAVTGISVLGFCGLLIFFNILGGTKKFSRSYWDTSENMRKYGLPLSLAMNIEDMKFEEPEGYSDYNLDEIIYDAEASYSEKNTSVSPHVIMIMNEAWSDLSVLGEFASDEPIMPYYESLSPNCVKGYMNVNVLGGQTANTEFEALTGDSLVFLPFGSVPYQTLFNKKIDSLVSVMKEQGYTTYAVHCNDKNAWNRKIAYSFMGFDDFISAEKFKTDQKLIRTFASDETDYKEVERIFEEKADEEKLFIFNVTIQNHADYSIDQMEPSVHITSVGGEAPTVDMGQAEVYLSLIRETDKALKSLIEYFLNYDEPVIICMFGDHEPRLANEIYESILSTQDFDDMAMLSLKYKVPYLIWTNYPSDISEYGEISSNYIGACLLDAAGLQLSPYQKFLLKVKDTYPKFNICMDVTDEDLFEEYRMLSYNHLSAKDYKKEYFSLK